MKVAEIKEKAKALGVKPGKMNKTDLIRAIQTQEGNTACFQNGSPVCDQMGCCWRADCLPTTH